MAILFSKVDVRLVKDNNNDELLYSFFAKGFPENAKMLAKEDENILATVAENNHKIRVDVTAFVYSEDHTGIIVPATDDELDYIKDRYAEDRNFLRRRTKVFDSCILGVPRKCTILDGLFGVKKGANFDD